MSSSAFRRCLPLLLAGLLVVNPARSAEDGMRTVDAKRFGVVARCPAAWRLVSWSTNDKAFVLRLPQEAGSPPGSVSCVLSLAPLSLEYVQKQLRAEVERAAKADASPPRKLVSEKLSTVSPQKFGEEWARKLGQRLDAEWQTTDARGRVSFEQQTSLILDGRLYTFSLRTDEEHYEQYRFDFEEMLQTMKLSPPEVDLEQVDGGYWMQREFRFALRLPDGWQPAFGGSDKALLFATGKRRDALTDQLQVSASAARPLALEKLRDTLPVEIAAADPGAKATCKIVPQGGGSAVEMLVETHRGETAVCMLERRFHGAQRNYEVRITCESAEFKAREADLRKALDSFREVAETPKKDIF